MWKLLFMLAALVVYARPAGACATCGCGDPTLTATGVEQPYKNRVRLALEERLNDHIQGDWETGERAYTLRSSLTAAWAPHPRVTVMAQLPWVSSWIAPMGRRAGYDSVNGLGDLELSLRTVVARDRRFAPHHLFWLAAGLKMPTGWLVRDADGIPFPEDDQPSSGSWDPFFGALYAWFSGD